MDKLSHFDSSGASRMVDVGGKQVTRRMARASGIVRMAAETLALVRDKRAKKGDVLEWQFMCDPTPRWIIQDLARKHDIDIVEFYFFGNTEQNLREPVGGGEITHHEQRFSAASHAPTLGRAAASAERPR